eukprot:CAMPEP_0177653016 /NCGR_PEP_ID=MMETSP0447-20121125/13483_1 /TAXON_ID=0 /ORGANISM="Stygamoeba regulata, Strain BSH-02190019" /LENGTH=229 /DNA_ID=CAMNT_0019156389 /DNA_START=195 /DNA_END=884 /DNA_ORIENTATION=+
MGAKQGKEGGSAPGMNAQKKKYANIDPKLVKEFVGETNFDKVEVKNLYEVFQSVAEDNCVKRDKFKMALQKLKDCGLKLEDNHPFADRLFEILDRNKDGVVDLQEFITGLSCLAKGTAEEKLALCFKAYDLDGNGTISKDELALMFKHAWISGFQSLCAIHESTDVSMDDLNEFSEEMATVFADNAFDTLDTNNDGQLSFQEFKEFALAEPKITATLNGHKKEVPITFG